MTKPDAVLKSQKVNNMRTKRLMESIIEGTHPCCQSGKKSVIYSVDAKKEMQGVRLLQLQEAFSAKDSPYFEKEWSHIVGTRAQIEMRGSAIDRGKNVVEFTTSDGVKHKGNWNVPCADVGRDKKTNALVSTPVYYYYPVEEAYDSEKVLEAMVKQKAEQMQYAKEHPDEYKNAGTKKIVDLESEKIEAKNPDIAHYLTDYLVACKMGCEFVAPPAVIKSFQNNVKAIREGQIKNEQGQFLVAQPFIKACVLAEFQADKNFEVAVKTKIRENEKQQVKNQNRSENQEVGR